MFEEQLVNEPSGNHTSRSGKRCNDKSIKTDNSEIVHYLLVASDRKSQKEQQQQDNDLNDVADIFGERRSSYSISNSYAQNYAENNLNHSMDFDSLFVSRIL